MAAGTGAFDAHHPPSSDLLADCVHCGFCLPPCPTYALWSRETDSPRGRIHLMKVAVEGKAAITPEYARHFDTCLGCMACVTACPSGVQYDKLIEAARPQIERHVERPLGDPPVPAAHLRAVPVPGPPALDRAEAVGLPAARAPVAGPHERSARAPAGAPARHGSGGAAHLAPRRLVLAAGGRPGRGGTAPPGGAAARLRAACLLQRGQSRHGPCARRGGVRGRDSAGAGVLRRPDAPRGARGRRGGDGAALHRHVRAGARRRRRGRHQRGRLRVDPQGVWPPPARRCGVRGARGGPRRQVPRRLRGAGRPRAARPAASRAAAGRLPRRLPPAARAGRPGRARAASLGAIPELDLQEVPEGELCCGSAGIYNLVEPEAAGELGRRKARNVLRTGADAVVSSNPVASCSSRARWKARAGRCRPFTSSSWSTRQSTAGLPRERPVRSLAEPVSVRNPVTA